MASTYVLAFFISLTLFFLSINAQDSSCNDETFSFAVTGKNVTHCKKLDTLEAVLGWNFYDMERSTSKINILFGAKLPSLHGWVAWGVNPDRPQMVGTRAVIALIHQNGSLSVDQYNITLDTKLGCRLQPSNIDLDFDKQGAVVNYLNETKILTMFFTLTLPSTYNISILNHVWQVGSRVDDMGPKIHATTVQNFDSNEVINLRTGFSDGHHHRHLRRAHGVLSIIGWGTFLPTGIIFARYFKQFPFGIERWFRWHLTFQLLAFVIGTIAWAIGISLGTASGNYYFKVHRIVGITIYSVALLQMLALWLRPKKNDDYRKYWHIYHHFLGYSLFSLIVVNIFQGIHILKPGLKWKWAYVVILSCLGLIVVVLEFITWGRFISERVIKRRQNSSTTGQEITGK